jgi:Protein of unknown function (DUF3040)
MSLPRRQQMILNQIEQALQAADPRLKTMFAAFGRSKAQEEAAGVPDAEVLADRPSRRTLAIFMMVVVCMLGVLVVGIRSTNSDCPGLSSDQVVASATARYAGCSHSTDAWSKGGRLGLLSLALTLVTTLAGRVEQPPKHRRVLLQRGPAVVGDGDRGCRTGVT